MKGARDMMEWEEIPPSLSPFLHPSIKSPTRETHVEEDQRIQQGDAPAMEGVAYVPGHASFFSVFESTGDSLVDARPPDGGAVTMEEDDAESCSYDDLGSEHSEEGCFEGGNSVEEGGDVRRDETGGGGRGIGRYKPRVSGESKGGGVDSMNEMERSKLFWEACLAS